LSGHKRGNYAAAIMKRGLHQQGWKLVVVGHSLGAGVAALLSLKLQHVFPGAENFLRFPGCGKFLATSLRRQLRKVACSKATCLAPAWQRCCP